MIDQHDFHRIREYINLIHPIEDELLNNYLAEAKRITIPKKTILTAEGQIEKYLYIVLDGIQRSYYIKGDKEYIIAFTYPVSFSGIPESFFTQMPSKYFLATITDSTFLRIPFKKHEEMMLQLRPIETLSRKTTELILSGLLDRYFELMAFSMEERFKSFVTRSPHLLQLVSQKDLASYLRMDSTNFSKLLNRIRI